MYRSKSNQTITGQSVHLLGCLSGEGSIEEFNSGLAASCKET